MPLGKGLLTINEGESVEEDGGVSVLPHGRGLWSPGCRRCLAKGSNPVALAGLSPDLAQRPSFWHFRHT